MNWVTGIIGVFLVSFGLIVRSTGLQKSRKNSYYNPMSVWFSPVSLGEIFILDGLFI